MIWTPKDTRHMLTQLDQSWSPPSVEALAALVRSWLFAVPFHNLDLLVGTSPLELESAAYSCLRLRGGGCHVHAAGFLALLLALGYDAQLTGADISAPGDHLMVKVRFGETVVWCDVGNGQPYLVPFRAGVVTTCRHLGWSVEAKPSEKSMVLRRCNRLLPEWKQVYITGLESRTWDDFAEAIHRHHSEPGFGPFLTGLRVAKIGNTAMVTIRDRYAAIWRSDATDEFHNCSLDQLFEMISAIVHDIQLVNHALEVWAHHGG